MKVELNLTRNIEPANNRYAKNP